VTSSGPSFSEPPWGCSYLKVVSVLRYLQRFGLLTWEDALQSHVSNLVETLSPKCVKFRDFDPQGQKTNRIFSRKAVDTSSRVSAKKNFHGHAPFLGGPGGKMCGGESGFSTLSLRNIFQGQLLSKVKKRATYLETFRIDWSQPRSARWSGSAPTF
jgi:hypothetical protein